MKNMTQTKLRRSSSTYAAVASSLSFQNSIFCVKSGLAWPVNMIDIPPSQKKKILIRSTYAIQSQLNHKINLHTTPRYFIFVNKQTAYLSVCLAVSKLDVSQMIYSLRASMGSWYRKTSGRPGFYIFFYLSRKR